MVKKRELSVVLIVYLTFTASFLQAQDLTERTITITELFSLVKENHPSLKPVKSDVSIAHQNVEVAKNQLLPEFSAGLQAYYIGDAYAWDKNFSNGTTIDMPHLGNRFSLDARQLIWKGGAVRNNIKVQNIREELAALNYENNEQNIKLLVLSYYLDLYKLYNQEKVYLENIELAEKRLVNINKYYNQGMVTRNDVIRGELQISNLKLALQVVTNNQQILNKQLSVALGLDDNIKILPDKTIKDKSVEVSNLEDYEKLIENHPTVQMTNKAVGIYELSLKINRAEMLPTLSAFAGNNLQRPIITTFPAMDVYLNSWNAGLALTFNLDALYKTPKKLKQNQFEKQKAIEQADEAQKMISVAVKAAHIKYNEALSQNQTLEKNTELVAENYRIMESKYNNQLALLLDLIDASNAKLDAELQYANSEINIIYTYYKLQKEAGSL